MYKQGNTWWCKITRPGQKPVYQRLGQNRRLAKAVESKLRLEIQEGLFLQKEQGEYLTVENLLGLYMEKHAKINRSPGSCERDSYLIRQINRKLGGLFLNEVSPEILEDYMAKRRADGVAQVTVHHELRLLRQAFSLAVKRWDLLKNTPFDKVVVPTGDRKRVRYLKPDEEVRLFEALAGKGWLKSLVIIARDTGLRLSNICELTWGQVDLAEKTIEIPKTKNGNPLVVYMTSAVYAELAGLSKTRASNSDRVFIVDGRNLNRNWVGHAFIKACRCAGVEDFHFHDLRHTFCSRLVQLGHPLNVVADLAGHKDLSSTRRYAHLSPEVKRNAIASLEGCNLAMDGKKDVAV